MFTIREYARPSSLEEAYTLLQKSKKNKVLGGCMWIKMTHMAINTAIDLSGLGLDQITEEEDAIVLGPMVTLRQAELSPLLRQYFGDAFASCVGPIVGTQFKNGATMGGSLFSRFGFSDILTLLVGLDAQVKLYHAGIMPVAEFARRQDLRDIIVEIRLPKTWDKVSYQCFRITKTDLPVLNCCVAQSGEKKNIVLGARPHMAQHCPKAESYWQAHEAEETMPREAALLAAEESVFGSNMRGSAEYRRILAETLVEDGLKEVLA